MEKITNLIETSDTWTIFNSYFLGDDIHRLRKFLVKHNLFKETLELPGNIVELGVFKGVGLSQLLKLREIYIPGSEKKVYGSKVVFPVVKIFDGWIPSLIKFSL